MKTEIKYYVRLKIFYEPHLAKLRMQINLGHYYIKYGITNMKIFAYRVSDSITSLRKKSVPIWDSITIRCKKNVLCFF